MVDNMDGIKKCFLVGLTIEEIATFYNTDPFDMANIVGSLTMSADDLANRVLFREARKITELVMEANYLTDQVEDIQLQIVDLAAARSELFDELEKISLSQK